MQPDECSADDSAVTRDVTPVRAADIEQSLQRHGPFGQVGIGVDRRVAGFLDEIPAEHHCVVGCVVGGGCGHDNDEVAPGVTRAEMANRHGSAAECDDRLVHPVIRRT